eukprot:1068517-Heterocapsa_arctica.AAC.1
MAFIKVARTARQEAEQKRKREQQEGYGKWYKGNDWSSKGQHYKERASSSGARGNEDGWTDNPWKEQAGWV